MDEELERFKRDIDLRQYAASTGYELDKRDSWRGSSVMRRGGDKVVIKRNAGRWTVIPSMACEYYEAHP